MEMNLSQLNSPIMWLGCGIPVVFLLFLTIRMWKKTYKTAKEIGLEAAN